jgi:hypothetical protein
MTPPRKCIAIKVSLSLAVLFLATAASAASIGAVTDLDGNLLVSRANGSVKVLGVGSAIEEGDILTSRKQTYVMLTMADDSSVTLGPDTDLKVERYVFDQHTPDNDGALFALANGSVRITSGLLGTRSGDTFELAAPMATIDMRNASVVVTYVAPDRTRVAWRDTGPSDHRLLNMVAVSYTPAADHGFVRTVSHSNTLQLAQMPPMPKPGSGGLRPGLYVQVMDGLIHLSNSAGSQSFSAGQFGFTPALRTPPIVLPSNPGMQFAPPPSFPSSAVKPGTTGGSKPNVVDCEVR